jgi:hypothetical protein
VSVGADDGPDEQIGDVKEGQLFTGFFSDYVLLTAMSPISVLATRKTLKLHHSSLLPRGGFLRQRERR